MDLKEYIRTKRSALSASSVIMYASVLRSLYNKVFNSRDIDVKKSMIRKKSQFLKEVPANRREDILSASVIITDNAEYREKIMGDNHTYNKDVS